MSSTGNTDKEGADGEQARFLARVRQTLDGSLTHLPDGVAGRLDAARHGALTQARESDSAGSAAGRSFVSTLETSERQLPESVTKRLDAIREGAMQRARVDAVEAANGRRWALRGFAVPASAFASVCMLVTTLAIFYLPEPPETMPLVVAENSLVLASEDEIELYENLEFYQWLADNGL